jgi:spermidine synthase
LAFIGFFAPAAVLSLVTPIAAKLLIASLDNAGSVVGNLSAIGTAGALFGTFVTGFVLIASVPSRPITWIVGGVLIALGIIALLQSSRRFVVPAVMAGILAVVGSSALAAPCDYETAYSCVQLSVDPDRPSGRILVLDTFVNSYVDVDDPTYLSSRYARVADAVVEGLAVGGPLDIAYIGGGGYTMPRFYAATRGGTSTVLELDDALLGIATEHLGLVQGDWLSTIVGDARITLPALPNGSYQVILGDAFSGRSVPWHLTTEQFLSDVRDKLTSDGIYVMNTIDHPPASFARAEAATIAAVFPHVAVVAPLAYLDGERGGNFILVGSNVPISTVAIEEHVTDGERAITGKGVLEWIGAARSLTDEFAPTDQLISRP